MGGALLQTRTGGVGKMLELRELRVVDERARHLAAHDLFDALQRALILHELEVGELEAAVGHYALHEAGVIRMIARQGLALAAREIRHRPAHHEVLLATRERGCDPSEHLEVMRPAKREKRGQREDPVVRTLRLDEDLGRSPAAEVLPLRPLPAVLLRRESDEAIDVRLGEAGAPDPVLLQDEDRDVPARGAGWRRNAVLQGDEEHQEGSAKALRQGLGSWRARLEGPGD
jgi:hypothetical protein